MTATPAADINVDELAINTIRTLAMDAVQKANWGTRARRWRSRRSPTRSTRE